MPTESNFYGEDGFEIDITVATWTTTTHSLMFYTSSVVSQSELKENGFVEDLLFPDYLETYCVANTIDWLVPTTQDLYSTTSNTFYTNELIQPSGSVAVMAQYSGDSSETDFSSLSFDDTRAIEYNVTDSETYFYWLDVESEELTEATDSNNEYWENSLGLDGTDINVSWAASYRITYLGSTVYDSSEAESIKQTFGTTSNASTISSSANALFDKFAADLYNAIPSSKFSFKKAFAYDLEVENLQPIEAGEGMGGSLPTSEGVVGYRDTTTTSGY
jgi:hypothetical protein